MSDHHSYGLDAMLEVLHCPRTGEQLRRFGDELVNESRSARYELIDGIPDLRSPPERLNLDHDWYEPWADLDSLKIAYPEPVKDDDALPYHLDRYLASLIPDDGGSGWFLEIGCGERQCEGWVTDRSFRYLGVDIDIRGNGPNVLADGHNLPISSESMNMCASMAVLEHVVSPLTFVREVFRVLKPGGTFIGSAAFMYGFHDRASFHHMSHGGLLYILRLAGFEVHSMWPDWRYPASISAWPFRGNIGAPWRGLARVGLEATEASFVGLSNLARRLVGKPLISRIYRDIQMAGSISFKACKPMNQQEK